MFADETDGFYQFGDIRRIKLEKEIVAIDDGKVAELIERNWRQRQRFAQNGQHRLQTFQIVRFLEVNIELCKQRLD